MQRINVYKQREPLTSRLKKQASNELQVRKHVADYNLYHPIGKGSFGEVVLAKKQNDTTFFACKVIKLSEGQSGGGTDRASVA